MRGFVKKRIGITESNRWNLLLIISGMASAVPFILPHLYFLSFVSYIPLFFTLFKDNSFGKRAIRSLFCFFLPFYVILYYWFVCLYPLSFAGLTKVQGALVVAIALVGVPLLHSAIMSFGITLLLRLCRNKKALLPVCASCAYVLCEYLQSLGTFALPWGRLFVGQIKCLPFLQSASLFGAYFITFVIILINALLAYSYLNTGIRKTVSALTALAVFVANLTFGVVRMAVGQEYPEEITVAALQGNMTSGMKWSGSAVSNASERYLIAADNAKKYASDRGKKIDLFLTAETAFPITLSLDRKLNNTKSTEKVLEFAKSVVDETDAVLIIGAFTEEDGKTYNSLYQFEKNGLHAKCYSKQHTVPFGEFLPYRSVLETLVPPMKELNLLGEDLSRGENQTPLETKIGKVACLVCYDSIFDNLARKQVKDGARIIAVSTNDSWYKTSKALDQHAAHSVMRAIENNVSLVRSANTGVSLTVNPYGEVTKSLGANKLGYVCDTLPVTSNVTLYTRIGNVIVLLCGMFLAVTAILSKINAYNEK